MLNSAALVPLLLRLMVLPVFPDLNPHEDNAEFIGFSKNDGDRPSGAGRSSKTFPEVSIECRVLCGKQESRQIIPLGLGILKG